MVQFEQQINFIEKKKKKGETHTKRIIILIYQITRYRVIIFYLRQKFQYKRENIAHGSKFYNFSILLTTIPFCIFEKKRRKKKKFECEIEKKYPIQNCSK